MIDLGHGKRWSVECDGQFRCDKYNIEHS